MRQKIDVKIYEKVKDEVIRDYQNGVRVLDIIKKHNISCDYLYECLGSLRRQHRGYHRPAT